jgi:hypothetical protein
MTVCWPHPVGQPFGIAFYLWLHLFLSSCLCSPYEHPFSLSFLFFSQWQLEAMDDGGEDEHSRALPLLPG